MKQRLIESLKKANAELKNIPEINEATICSLANYLIKNGVIVPPCKFGDTVYVIPSKANYGINVVNGFEHLNKVYEQKVCKVEIYANNKYLLSTCDGMQSVHSDLFNETWFLSKEEAEQKLVNYKSSKYDIERKEE